jgi:hypothetical protein
MDDPLLRAHALAETQHGVASRAQVLALGISEGRISHQVRTGMWDVILPGTYDLHARLRDGDVPWRSRLIAAQLAHPGQCAAVLPTAGRLWGLPYTRDRLVHVAVRPGLEQVQRPGYRFHTWQVPPLDIVRKDGLLITSPARTVADLLLIRGREQGVATLDAAVHLGLIDPERDVRVIAAIMGGRRGVRRARTYLDQFAVGAQSPLETRIRLIATDAGMPPDGLQVPIYDDAGALLGYGDIGWRTRRGWLIAECDGEGVHALPSALLHDRHRQNEFLLRPGVGVVRFTWADSESPAYVVSVLRRALGRR